VRRRVPVSVGEGGTREAWVYVYNESVGGALGPGRPRVGSGDWRAHLAARAPVSR
jgi:gamma-glutamylcyclotransferase (GGCT)/AIG2-like uncharacterized protein YtfP